MNCNMLQWQLDEFDMAWLKRMAWHVMSQRWTSLFLKTNQPRAQSQTNTWTQKNSKLH